MASAQTGEDFAGYADDPNLVTFSLDASHGVGYAIAGAAHVAGQASGNQVTYPDAFTDADVQLLAGDGTIKEQLILKSAGAPTTWTFPLSLTGLHAQMLADGDLAFIDDAGNQQAYVPGGFMTDSTVDAHTGEGVRSNGVTYSLTTVNGAPALQVQLDKNWLNDPARTFPVTVDPSVDKISDSRDTYVMYPFTNDYSGDTEMKVGTYDGGAHKAKAFMGFGSVGSDLPNEFVVGANLYLYNSYSYSCKSAPVYVYPITQSWSVSTTTSWPGPSTGSALDSRSFAHGYRPDGSTAYSCNPAWDSVGLGPNGNSLINGWTHGTKANNGLAVGASTSSSYGYKRFTTRQNSASSGPQLWITYTKYGVSWPSSIKVTTQPSASQDGVVAMTLKNLGTETWTPTNGYKLGYTLYDSTGKLIATTPVWTTMPSSVAPNASVTVNAKVQHVPAGDYVLHWGMYDGSTSFYSQGDPVFPMKMTIPDSPPVITGIYPPSGYVASTLNQQLSLTAYDPNNTAISYDFKICKTSDSSSCVDSGTITKPYWTPQAGKLVWNTSYTWTGKATSNGVTTTIGPVGLNTAVPQPVITQHLAAQSGGQAFDPQVGNYTTSATDAAVAAAGPELSVRRTYNSLDPRTALPFGAGWATPFDVHLTPDNDGSGSVVVTMADGHEVRLGKNPDGTFAPPVGDFATLTANTDGTYTLLDKTGSRYDFATSGLLSTLTDANGLKQTYTYDGSGHLQTVTNPTANRTLHFTWSGTHIASVSTDTVDGKTLTWSYTYNGDQLSTVCGPTGACTTYDYTDGSHYRSAVIDAAPQSYYRLGDASGTDASSEVDINQGKDDGTYTNVTLGAGGALAGTSDTAATFNGTSSYVQLPDRQASSNTYLSVELWFKTTSPGVLYSEQTNTLAGTAASHVPNLYVGTDGKLRGQFWTTTATTTPITSTTAVNDGTWHYAVLTGAGTTQALYLDGAQVGTLSGQIDHVNMTHNYAGAGFWSYWPAVTGTIGYFNGSIDEAAVYPRPLGLPAIQAHYNLGRTSVSQLSQITMPSGNTAAQATYDVGQDRVDTYTDANGGTWQLSDPNVTGADTTLTRAVTVTDPAGHTTTYSYDPLAGGRITGVQRGDDPARTYTYDSGGFLAKQTDENGHLTTLTHDARGNILSRTTYLYIDPDPTWSIYNTSYYSYYLNAANPLDPRNDRMTASRNGNSDSATDTTYQTSYTYTAAGQLATVTTPATTDFPNGRTTRHTFTVGTEAADGGGTTPAGLPASDVTPGGKTTSYTYYADGDLAQVTEPSGEKIRYTYDAIGRRLTSTQITDAYPAGVTTTTTYTDLSRPATITYPPVTDQSNPATPRTHTRVDTYSYDDDANTTQVTSTDTTGGDPDRTVTYAYDDHDRLHQATDPEGAVTGYDYDESGNLVHTTDPGGHEYAYTYNDRNQRTQTTLQNWSDDPNADPTSGQDLVVDSYAYDPAGRLASQTDAMGRTDTYTYFDDDTLGAIERTMADGSTVMLHDYGRDGAGQIVGDYTPNGTEIDYNLDEASRLTSQVLDSYGLDRTISFTYNADDDPSKVTYSQGTSAPARIVDYTYDAAGNMASQAVSGDGTSRLTTYTRDQRGLPTAITDPRGNASGADASAYTTHMAYDEAGNLAAVTAPPVKIEAYQTTAATTGPVIRTGYNTYGEVTAQVDGNGNTTTYTRDRDGRATTVTDPAYTPPSGGSAITPVTHYTYDDAGNLTAATDPAGQTTTYDYDAFGNVVQRTDPQLTGQTAPGVWTYTYDADSEPLSTTDPTGAQTQATYDNLGRQLTSTDVVRDSNGTEYFTTNLQYDSDGNLTKATTPTGVATTYGYDSADERTSRTDTLNNSTTSTYDQFGNLTKQTLPTGEGVSYSYDAVGNQTGQAELDHNGNVLHSSSVAYDLAGNPITSTDARGHATTFTYDGLNQLTQQIEPVDSSHSITTSYGYDAAGNRTRYTDGRGNQTWTTYNPWNLPESVIEPATTATPNVADRTYTTGYNTLRNVAQVSEPGGVTQTDTYDELGRLTKQTGAGAEAATSDRTFIYDLAGRTRAALTSAGENDFTYDDRGLLLTANGPSGNSSFTYNPDGAMTSRTDASGTTTYGYDTDGRLATAADPITGRTDTYGYDNDSHPATITYGTGGPVRAFTWGDSGNLQSDTITNPTGQTIASTSYVYNPDHQIQTKTTTGYADPGTTNYTYDWAGRLKTQTAGTTTTNYTFDDSGNLTSDGTHTKTYDERDRLTSDGTATYTYTPRGTQASKTTGGQTTNYAYDAYDQLTTAGSTTYSYDALNRLIQGGGTNLAYSGSDNTPATDGTATYSRDTNGDLLGIAQGTNKTAAITDQNHNDLTATLNPTTSTITGFTAYDPYGNPTATTGTPPALGYQAGYTDPTTGLVNMHARWYNPTTGNFTSRDSYANDPTPDSANADPYTYAAGDPIDNTDPSGHCLWDLCIAEGVGAVELGGLLIAGLGGSYYLSKHPPSFTSHSWGGSSTYTNSYPYTYSGATTWTDLQDIYNLKRYSSHYPGAHDSRTPHAIHYTSAAAAAAAAAASAIYQPPPPPADPCAHNQHCSVPRSPKAKPDFHLDHESTIFKDLPADTPTVIGAAAAGKPATIPTATAATGAATAGLAAAQSTPANPDPENCQLLNTFGALASAVSPIPLPGCGDSGGRAPQPRGTNGRFQPDPNVTSDARYERVTLRSSTKQAIRDAAPRDADGNFIDPNTGESIPAEGPFHYGHKPGFEYWRNRDMARVEGWTREQFIEYENDPSHYQIEDPYNNLSHKYEQP